MADKMRWRYGDTKPVVAAVDAETVIELGDLLWQDVDDAKPASRLRERTSREVQAAFAASFLGVAMQRSRAGQPDPIRVAATGVFEFDCDYCRVELGQLFGLAHEGSQQVTWVEELERAIGRAAWREPEETGSVLIDIRSTVMTGGIVQARKA